MLSALFHPRIHRPRKNSTYSSSAYDSPVVELNRHGLDHDDLDDEVSSEDEDDSEPNPPLLPIFAADLDSIPVYNLVHAIRAQIEKQAPEISALTWEQLKSPQVSSFVVKPILTRLLQMEDKSVRKGLIYGLMANCLQFGKEAEENPAIAGSSKTRALLCELLAIKLLKEFTSRELIDALSYDFYPLQGMPSTAVHPVKRYLRKTPQTATASRISALEIAIRAHAKKFVAHPLVIRHLEAIWAGNIVFHSAYDQWRRDGGGPTERRSVTIYDGRHAGPFKLSRLRIPRYRHIFSTFSLTVLLYLHLRVLIERSYVITPLEIGFWLWSFGFMIDEIADFTESGVSLYFLSMWNAFDCFIFVLLLTFYTLRVIGLFMPNERDYITDWSFDILATCSVFLFPRIFSILDHYRYFSQLIIAFRIMAADMIALLVLIVVSCSGFFVAFAFSFVRDSYSASDISYALFQILMGFTPAAWESWHNYNLLGKFLLTAFLIICHFLIVTILITVLTNSFAAVAANSVEEHQFLVAVNTISLVKNESIFTYLGPTNLIAWVLHPLRYFMPFRRFVKMNRTVVKVTHFPLLLAIYFYERTMLRSSIFVPADAVKNNAGPKSTMIAFQTPNEHNNLGPVASQMLRRKGSVGSHMTQQERVLEEVFARPYKGAEVNDMDNKGNVVDSWVNNVLAASPPTDAGRGVSSRRGRPAPNRFSSIRDYGSIRRLPPRDFSMTRSAHSDPDVSTSAYDFVAIYTEDDADNEDDDETNEESAHEAEDMEMDEKQHTPQQASGFDIATASTGTASLLQLPEEDIAPIPPRKLRSSRHHSRAGTNDTAVFSPKEHRSRSPSSPSPPPSRSKSSAKSKPRPITGRPQSSHLLSTTGLEEGAGMVPSSFATQMAMATGDAMLGKLVLAKIGALEESIDAIKELLGEQRRERRRDRSRDNRAKPADGVTV